MKCAELQNRDTRIKLNQLDRFRRIAGVPEHDLGRLIRAGSGHSSVKFRSEHNPPILLHAHDGDAVLPSFVEPLGQWAQPELAVVGCLARPVVMMEKQRKPGPRPDFV